MSLKEYVKKRDFKKTDEPPAKLDSSQQNRFVIQKHAASHLHYDFRLELDGTLKSWAVPKGPPYKKGEKKLAMEVEDHPVSYIDFEGIIPQGEYGGGTVMVWDFGTFQALSKNPVKELSSGKLHFILKGQKLKGEWYLVRLQRGNQWLLIKGGTDHKIISQKLDDTSAVSGRSMKLISKSDQVWKSNRKAKIPPRTEGPDKKPEPVKRTKAIAKFIEPMKAKLVDQTPAGDWSYEIKFDGFRAEAVKKETKVSLISRNKKDFNEKFPNVVEAISSLKVDSCVIDGEICAIDEKGISSFQLLQSREIGKKNPHIVYYAFDLLQLNGESLLSTPLEERKSILQDLLKKSSSLIQFSSSLNGNVGQLLAQASKIGLEGLIGKQKSSVYEPGKRSGQWIKLKLNHEQEFVIGGFSQSTGARSNFGAILIGYYKGGKLQFAGKVGTGFNEALLQKLYLKFKKIQSEDCPFFGLPEKKAGRYGSGITASEMKKCTWLKPALVCQVKFTEWTGEGKLRHPVFLGLREDKSAKEVVREKSD